MKKLLIMSTLATSLATTSVLAAPQVTQKDIDQIFNDQQQIGHIATLSDQEMKETEGEFLAALFLIGAVAATVGYAVTSGGGFDPHVSVGGGAAGIVGGGAGGAAAGGLVGGAYSGLTAERRRLEWQRLIYINNPVLFHQLQLMGHI